jgi:hypothetical protein
MQANHMKHVERWVHEDSIEFDLYDRIQSSFKLMISKSREVGVHIPSLLEKVGNEVDKWCFSHTTGRLTCSSALTSSLVD